MKEKVDWSKVVSYDETSPSCLRWAVNIPYKSQHGVSSSFKRVVGDVAGSLQKSGNRYKLKYRQQAYMVHRIVYELFYGPPDENLVIDHKDGDSSNNKISNLRLVTSSINAKNSAISSSNTSGVTGVTYTEVVDRTRNVVYRYYMAHWTNNDGGQENRYFSVAKLDEKEAFRLACEYREKMIAELNAQGAGYTEDHGKRKAA